LRCFSPLLPSLLLKLFLNKAPLTDRHAQGHTVQPENERQEGRQTDGETKKVHGLSARQGGQHPDGGRDRRRDRKTDSTASIPLPLRVCDTLCRGGPSRCPFRLPLRAFFCPCLYLPLSPHDECQTLPALSPIPSIPPFVLSLLSFLLSCLHSWRLPQIERFIDRHFSYNLIPPFRYISFPRLPSIRMHGCMDDTAHAQM